ncbi:MAG: hypothetical protein QM635_10140 [Microbacteriaceae bacterium]
MAVGVPRPCERGVAAITDALDKSLEALDDIAGLCARCDDVTRRMCNQAFFDKIYVDEDAIRPSLAEPFKTLLDPEVHANALTWAKNAHGVRTLPDLLRQRV